LRKTPAQIAKSETFKNALTSTPISASGDATTPVDARDLHQERVRRCVRDLPSISARSIARPHTSKTSEATLAS
jgi:hypothetical protein